MICSECIDPLFLNLQTNNCEFEFCDIFEVWLTFLGHDGEEVQEIMVRARCLDCAETFGEYDGRCHQCLRQAAMNDDGTLMDVTEYLEELYDIHHVNYMWYKCLDCNLEEVEPFNAQDCLECAQGYVLVENEDFTPDYENGPPHICERPVVDPPAHCEDADPRDAICVGCEDGYRLNPIIIAYLEGTNTPDMPPLTSVNPQCIPCGDNCDDCTSDECTQCTGEMGEYRLSDDPYHCEPICDGDGHCETCSNPAQCEQCEDGYWPDDNGVCVTCEETGCGSCNQEDGACEVCDDDYTMDPNTGECVPDCDLEDCETCGDPSTCTSCEDGFFLNDDNLCSPCSDLCDGCDGNLDNCDNCATEDPINAFRIPGSNNCTNVCDMAIDHCIDCTSEDGEDTSCN